MPMFASASVRDENADVRRQAGEAMFRYAVALNALDVGGAALGRVGIDRRFDKVKVVRASGGKKRSRRKY